MFNMILNSCEIITVMGQLKQKSHCVSTSHFKRKLHEVLMFPTFIELSFGSLMLHKNIILVSSPVLQYNTKNMAPIFTVMSCDRKYIRRH